jgi:Protein of unknown function (DUF3570)
LLWLQLLVLATGAGCAAGPVVEREVLSDPLMRFTPARVLTDPTVVDPERDEPLAPNTVVSRLTMASDPGSQVKGFWLRSILRAAVEVWQGLAVEAGYGADLDKELIQKLDGFAGPVAFSRLRHGPDAALVLDDGSSLLRVGYRFRTAFDGALHEPFVMARTSVLRRDTVVEVSYRHVYEQIRLGPEDLPALGLAIDKRRRGDWLGCAFEQGFLPGFNLRLDLGLLLEDGFLQSPYRVVSLYATRTSADETAGIPRIEPEKHPGKRVRYGGLVRLRHLVSAWHAAFELDLGHGSDTWRVEHSRVGLAYRQRLGDLVQLALDGELYHQTRALFYRDDYPDGPPGAYWSADRSLCSFLAGVVGATVEISLVAERRRLLSMFRYLTLDLGVQVAMVNYRIDGAGSPNGFTSYATVASSKRERFQGGLVISGSLGFEGGF